MSTPDETGQVPEDANEPDLVDESGESEHVDEATASNRARLVEVMHEDFGSYSREVFEKRYEHESSDPTAMESIGFHMAFGDLSFDEKGQFVWYDGREGYHPEVPIGRPEDYLEIRDDYDAVKSFVATTLDRGRVHAGGGTHANDSRETNCADYISWLYAHCNNNYVLNSLELAVSELLAEELEREFTPYDFDAALVEETEAFETGHCEGDVTRLFHNEAIGTARWRHGLNTPISPEDEAFREWFDRELEPTVRKDPNTRSNTEITHFSETSPEFQNAFKDRYLRHRATDAALQAYAPQFNRLIGLLDVATAIGRGDGSFSRLYAILKQKAEERFMIDSAPVVHHYSESDIYMSVLTALSSLQEEDELESFWLDLIENDPQPQRVIASVHGLLSNVGLTWEQLQTYISSILGRLQQRAVDMDVDYQSSAMGFLFDENLLNDLVRLIADRCYATGTYYHIDRESGALDFLTSEEITANGCDISCTRYTPNGVNELRALLHIVDDEVQGDAELEQTMRTYFDTMGYPLQSGVRLTSLEGRAIQNGESLIVEVGDQPIDGLYEGFIGLGHSHFPFLYDPVKHTVLLAEPMETRSVLFRVKNSWVSRRKGMEDIDTKIPYEAMQGVADIGEKIDATVAARKQTVLGDSLFSLEGKLSPELSPALAKIIEGRLIRNGDGLVE